MSRASTLEHGIAVAVVFSTLFAARPCRAQATGGPSGEPAVVYATRKADGSIARTVQPAGWGVDPSIPGPFTGPDAFVRIRVGSDIPGLSYSLERVDPPFIAAYCRAACTVFLPRGRYRLHIPDTPGRKGGTRVIDIDAASAVIVDPPSDAVHGIGLGLGIVGSAAAVLGFGLVANSLCAGENCHGSGSSGLTGLWLLFGGAIVSPMGWIAFGANRRPSVDVVPDGVTASAAASRLALGLAVAPGATGLRATFVF